MPFTRRNFLRISLGAGLLAASGYLFKDVFLPSQLTEHEIKTLKVLLATLIPDDETPGALQLGVAEKILAKAEKQAQYRRTIKKGSAWLDKTAGKLASKTFAELREDERDVVIARAFAMKTDSPPGIFIELMRWDAFEYYYGDPRSWAQLGYAGPPQPNGFPHYTDSPRLS